MKEKSILFHRDFTLVVIGQIISLFGNAVLRFALPLYLLRETGSAALFGFVTACSFVPMVLLSMIGGVMADRVNKRNIMAGLDFCTAALLLLFQLALGRLPAVPLFLIALMLLYGISGAYQPAVQASIPLLVSQERLIAGNAVINQVSTLSGLLGPVIGGILFSLWGLSPILVLSTFCFACSAVMELFLHIPHEKQHREKGILAAAGSDLKESYVYVKTQKPFFFSVVILICLFNLVLSAVLIVGIPILVTQVLKLSDTLYGLTQGALALGGLCGGFLTAAAAKSLRLRSAYLTLLACAGAAALMGLPLMLRAPVLLSYLVITLMSFAAMAASTLFVVQIYTLVQREIPPQFVGKVMAALLSIAMCGQPVGQAVYGILFDVFQDRTWIVLMGAAAAAFLIALYSKKLFRCFEDSIS